MKSITRRVGARDHSARRSLSVAAPALPKAPPGGITGSGHSVPAPAEAAERKAVASHRLSPEASERIKLASLVCSLLVCLGHAYLAPDPGAKANPGMSTVVFIEVAVKHGLARVSTPFFFLIAAWMLTNALVGTRGLGPLVDRSRYRAEIRKRVSSLLVPFAIWSGVSFAALFIVQTLWPGLGLGALAPASPAAFARLLFWDPVAYPLWFIRNLFLLSVVAPILVIVLSRRWLGLGALALMTVAWFSFSSAQTTRAVLFFSLGSYLALHPVRVARPGLVIRSTLPVLWLVVAGVIAWSRLAMGGESGALRNAAVLLGLATLWWSMPIVSWMRHRSVQAMTGFTFFVYVFHEPLITFLRAIAKIHLTGNAAMHAATWLMVGISAFAISVLVGRAWERWAPRSYAIVSGGRAPRQKSDQGVAVHRAA